jgi:hypothetical protein
MQWNNSTLQRQLRYYAERLSERTVLQRTSKHLYEDDHNRWQKHVGGLRGLWYYKVIYLHLLCLLLFSLWFITRLTWFGHVFFLNWAWSSPSSNSLFYMTSCILMYISVSGNLSFLFHLRATCRSSFILHHYNVLVHCPHRSFLYIF